MAPIEPGPLPGITVVDLTVNIAGPFTTLVLRDLGARVIKVEPPPKGDHSREWWPSADGVSAVFSSMNRGKESVVVDAKSAAGRHLLHDLIAGADVFVESMRPGKADALGLGWEELRELNERLVYCSVNAFGDSGPMAGVAGFDAVIQAYSGLIDLTGYPDAPPSRVGGAVIDVGTGVWAALGIVAALMQRAADGRGRLVPVTMLGTGIAYLMHHLTSVRLTGVVPTRIGTAQHNFAPYQAIQAKDRMVMVGVNTDQMWRRMATAIGREELADDPRFATNPDRIRNRDELIAEIEAAIAEVEADAVMESLMERGIPVSVVRPIDQVAEDPQLEAAGLWGRTPDGKPLPRIPIPDCGPELGGVAAPGEHTRAILGELGHGDSEVDRLLAERVVAEPQPGEVPG